MGFESSTVTIEPKEQHRYSLIWLHGLGDTGQGFKSFFTSDVILPHCKVILPTAPKRKVTVLGGQISTSWYDITSFSNPDVVTDQMLAKKFNQQQIKISVGKVVDLINAEVEKLGDPSKVFIGGFS